LRTILFTRRIANGWTKPKPVSFSGKYMDEYPTFSPDAQTLFFQSTRPIPDSLKNKPFRRGFRFWASTKSGDEWREPIPLDASINVGICISTVTSKGTIYFSVSSPPVIVMSHRKNGVYSKPIRLGPPINDDKYGSFAPCLSPEEDFLIFASGRPGFGKSDLWISFKSKDGSWSEPKNLGSPLNTASSESSPVISPDGKYLFYTSQGDIYWVDIRVLEGLKNK
jgi:hypothetical protein